MERINVFTDLRCNLLAEILYAFDFNLYSLDSELFRQIFPKVHLFERGADVANTCNIWSYFYWIELILRV